MPKITVRDILDLGINADLFQRSADSEVVGSDGLNYYCISPVVAAAGNKPITGASWQAHYVQYGSNGKVWVADASHKTPFTDYVNPIINTESAKLQKRVGDAAYNNAAVADDVKRAELCLVAAELVGRRINLVLRQVQPGITVNINPEISQKKAYLDEVNGILLPKIIAGTPVESSGFACGSLISSHFETTNA